MNTTDSDPLYGFTAYPGALNILLPLSTPSDSTGPESTSEVFRLETRDIHQTIENNPVGWRERVTQPQTHASIRERDQ